MSVSMRKPINPAVIRKSVVANNTRRLSYLQNNQTLLLASLFPLETKSELTEIFNEAKKESVLNYNPPFQSVSRLSFYIRRNRNNIDETIKNLYVFLDTEDCLTERVIINIIDTVLNLLTENSQIINFINKMFPVLVSRFYLTNLNIEYLEEINNTVGELIKIGVVYSRQIIENNIDSLFNKISSNESYLKSENTKCAIILFICKIIQSSNLFAFNKLTEKKNFKILQNLLENYKDPKKETRDLVYELVYQFCLMLKTRDSQTKFSYIKTIYGQIMYYQFMKNIHDSGDTPSNIYIFCGYIEVVKKIYLADPLFFLKDDKAYEDLSLNVFKSKNSKSQAIKIEFIKFIPDLYLINKEIFTQKYLNNFFEFSKGLLTVKANQDIRNALLVSLGKLSLLISREKFDYILSYLLNLLQTLIMESKAFDKEIFKCLSDLLNNKDKLYLESIVTKFDIYFILSKLFKSGLTGDKVEFLLAIMSSFNFFSLEHVTAVIVSLHVISYIICDEEMNLNYFEEAIKNKNINFISPNLIPVKKKAIKHIKKFIEGNDKDSKNISLANPNNIFSKCKCLNKPNIIIYSLILLSHIQNSFFLKDILIFYNDKILPFLLLDSPIIRQKVLQLILCRFVQIYDDDKNFSYYILNNIVDSIRNVIFSCKDIDTKILAFNILHCKTILLDTILREKNFFFCKLIGLLTSNEDNSVKEKLIQTVGLLALRENDKSFYISFLNKNILNILFTISNSDDIIHKENLIKILLYYTKYLKNIYNSKLVEGTMEILINMLFNYDSNGIIIIDILKIICELLDSKIINNLFYINGVYSQKFNEHCHLLLIICINIINEEGVNSAKSEISLNTIYQIVRLHKLNIYKDYTPETLLKNSINNDENTLRSKYQSLRISDYSSTKKINKDDNISKNRKFNEKQNKNDEQNNINKELISLLENSSRFNIAGILLQTVVKGSSDESLRIIMNIFGFSGVLDPLKLDKNLTNQSISVYRVEGITIEKESIENNDLKVIRYNPKLRQEEEIDLSMIDPSTCKPVLSLIRILLDNSQQETSNQIINYFNDLVKYLLPNDQNLIDVILPTIFHVMPELDVENQKKLFRAILTIIENFKNKIIYHLNSLIKLIQNCIISDELLEIITDILKTLFEQFVYEMERYYPTLIPILLSIIKEKMNESADLLTIFTLMAKNVNIGTYLNIILEEIMTVYLRSTNKNVLDYLLDFFEKIIIIENTYLFYPIIVKSLIEKLFILTKSELFSTKSFKLKYSTGMVYEGENSNFVNKTIDIFALMNKVNREHFIKFLPMIIKNCKILGIINKPSWEKTLRSLIIQYNDYNLSPMVFQNILKEEYCRINCVLGLNTQKKENNFISNFNLNDKDEESNSDSDNSSSNSDNDNERNKKVGKKSNSGSKKKENINRPESGSVSLRKKYKNRKELIDINQILNLFSTANCAGEDDWNEWFKSSSKILFEQSPSYILYYCHFVIDYYFPLIRELYSYAFYSTIKNINEESKSKIVDELISALNSPKTPNDILLIILNLTEYIERKNLGISFFDYYLFGNVAYKCRAFAKALYFKENYFLINKGSIEDLLELYYELKLPESAAGLLKFVQKNETTKKRKDSKSPKMLLNKKSNDSNKTNEEDKEFSEHIWYIKLHEYKKSLDIINNRLKYERNKEEIEDLKKNRNICLNGLCDWEQLLLDEENNQNKNNNTNDTITNLNNAKSFKGISDIDKELKDNIEKELLLSKACMNLGEWNKLQIHFSKVNEIFRNYYDIESQLIVKDNEDSEEIFIDDNPYIKKDKNSILGNSNVKRLEKLYLSIPKYLTNYEKHIDKSSINKNFDSFSENNENKKNVNTFLCYNDIINNSPNLSFLLNQDEVIFDLNLYSSLLNIENKDYNLALEYVAEDKKMINSRIKSLLGESYSRGYELLIKNQILFNLEQIINYRTNHIEDKEFLEDMVQSMDKSLEIIGKDPVIYEKFLAVRSLILPIEKEFNNYLNLSEMFRKMDFYDKSLNVLNRIKNKMNLNNINIGSSQDLLTNEMQVKIELCYNQCLFEKGLIFDAINKSQYLVDLLEKGENNKDKENDNNILIKLDDKIKSQIYGNLGIYMQKDFNFNEDLKNNHQEFNTSSLLRSSHRNFNIRSLNNLNIQEEIKKNQSAEINILNKKTYDGSTINHYLSLSTNYDKASYKYWQNYAMFNYKYYKFLFDKRANLEEMDSNEESAEGETKIEEKINIISNKIESSALNAVNGFKYSITLGGKNMNKTFQDLLRLIDIFFNSGGNSKNLLMLIESSFNSIDVDAYLNVIPQLICRFDLKNEKVLKVLIKLLIKIGLIHPNALIYPLIVMKFSSSKCRKDAATSVLNGIMKNHKKLIEECEMFIIELNKCAMLPHEEWYEIIEDVSKLFQDGEYNIMVEHIKRLHLKLEHHFDSMYEINFFQRYGSSLKEAEENIKIFMETHNDEYIKSAWEIYHRIYREISEDYKNFDSISLEYVSPKLFNFKNSNICLPGTYKLEHFNNNNFENDNNQNNKSKESILTLRQEKMIRIQKMGDTLKLFKTKQHPRKMTMIGTNEKEYMFLLKGHEDLRQDERAMQLFDLVNTIVSNNRKTYNKNLFIITYSVFPLSHNTGIIGWVQNCDTLNQLIRDQRAKNNILPSAEHRVVYTTYPKFESSTVLGKVETFLEALKVNQGTELYNMIWSRAKNCETWLSRRTNYSRSLAVMSIVGYILGLGDRHPSNLMMNRKTGKIIHIDFGDCFEVAMKREKFPEKVPFRLTRILIKALEVSEIEGTFRLVCEKIMELLRDNKDSLMAILSSFLHDPLISFRLMIPMIMKNKKNIDGFDEKLRSSRKTIKKKIEDKDNFKENNISKSMKITNKPVVRLSQIFNPFFENQNDKNKEKKQKRERKVVFKLKEEEKEKEKTESESINEDKEKNEKKKLESDERQLFNQYEENDEIDLEELNRIAKFVLDRIQDKLSGTDFNPDIVYDVKSQVDKLIQQATSNENLAQSYLGWCPFW